MFQMSTIGVASGTLELLLLSIFPHISIVGVDIDPVVLDLVQKHFQLKVANVT